MTFWSSATQGILEVLDGVVLGGGPSGAAPGGAPGRASGEGPRRPPGSHPGSCLKTKKNSVFQKVEVAKN